jgi:biotin synthase-like enzyme
VRIIPTLLHAPNQAFVNIHNDCIFRCSFCETWGLETHKKKNRSPQEAVALIAEAAGNRDFASVAVTSGVSGSIKKTIDDMVYVIENIRRILPRVDIGVEPYVDDAEDIDRLFRAGATEIKINIESYDRDIFGRICPNMDLDNILRMLEHAVEVFGRGKVASNIIVGLGESDENVLAGVSYLAGMGVVANLRVLRVNDKNCGRISETLGYDVESVPPERMITLSLKQKAILEDTGLSTRTFHTMCHECECCDIVPGKDV